MGSKRGCWLFTTGTGTRSTCQLRRTKIRFMSARPVVPLRDCDLNYGVADRALSPVAAAKVHPFKAALRVSAF